MVSSLLFKLSLVFSTQFWIQENDWALVFKNGVNPDITLGLQFEEFAVILEQLAKKSKKIRGFSENVELSKRIADLTNSERQIIKSQVLKFRISATGGLYVLDTTISNTKTSPASVIPTVKFTRSLPSTGLFESHNLRWLKDQKGPVVLRDIKHRHAFNRDVHFGGLLTSSQFSCVFLMEAWPAELQSKAADVHPGIAKEDKLKDCRLVCVKMAKGAEGHRRLRKEAAALHALQDTGRVAELWNPGELARFLDRGMLITLYQPVPPPQDSGQDVFLSLDELEDRIEELAHALAVLHKSGWIWLGMKPGHILYHHSRMDPRDQVPPLRIIGLENSWCLRGKYSFENAPDPIWAAPEVKTQQPTRSLKATAKCQVSAVQNFILESGPTPAADMYSLGLLISAHLARSPHPVVASNQELCSFFNNPVYDAAQQIHLEHWLVRVGSELVQTDPLLRPTAEQVLQRISSGRRQHTRLEMHEPSISQIDAYIHPDTLLMVWPVVLKTTIIIDQRNASRLTDYVTVHTGLETPPGKVVADYRGRPVSKEYLRWLRHLQLHTHALNDGEKGAYDGRRKCNGIFDMAFYKHFRQVRSKPPLRYKQKHVFSH